MQLKWVLEQLKDRALVELYIVDHEGRAFLAETARAKQLLKRVEKYEGYEVAEIFKRKYTDPYALEIYLEGENNDR